jgi:hypothetical protein
MVFFGIVLLAGFTEIANVLMIFMGLTKAGLLLKWRVILREKEFLGGN